MNDAQNDQENLDVGNDSQTSTSFYTRFVDKMHQTFNDDFLRYIISVLCYFVIFTVGALIFSKTLPYLLPFWIALIIAVLLQPLIKVTVQKFKWKRDRAAAILLVIVILAIIALLSWIIFQIVSDIIQIVESIRNANLSELLTTIENRFGKIPLLSDENVTVTSLIQKYRTQIMSALNKNKSVATSALSSIMAALGQTPLYVMLIVATIFAAYYFARDLRHMTEMPAIILKKNTLEDMQKVETESFKIISRYIALYLRAAAISMVVSYIIFLIFGVQYSFLFAALIGVFELIPVIGPWLVYIPLALHFALYGEWFMMAVMIGSIVLLYLIGQFTKSKSKVLSRSMQVHPLMMVAITFWSLRAGSASLLVYLTILVVGYKILLQTKIIVSPFAKKEVGEPPEKEKHSGLFKNKKLKEEDPDGETKDRMATDIEKTFLNTPDDAPAENEKNS